MLTTLKIENFAIVSQLEIDFSNGMTAFTGETGAGKSIMIDALMLALGSRTDTSVIRTNTAKCEISASFLIDKNGAPTHWLSDHDVDCHENEIILRRVIYAEGRSKSYINGHPFPLQKIKELASMLVDIHGQHQHQTLLQHPTHRKQLDHYAGNDDLLKEITACYNEHHALKQQLNKLKDEEGSLERKTLLQYQIAELDALNLQDNEMQRLSQEHQLLHNAQEYLDHYQHMTQLLNENEQGNICSGLNQVSSILASLPTGITPSVQNAAELINSALIQCEEAQNEINLLSEQIQLDPERLEAIESRLSTLHHVARKYHVDSNELTTLVQTLKTALEQLDNQSEEKTRLETQINTTETRFNNLANSLRVARQKSAEKLAREISALIRQLGMPKGYIEISITPLDTMHPHGLDKVEYLVCANPGIAPNSLSKVASGGELSRISLAIQMIAAQHGATPTLLFDEVDVGIGGQTAALVGQMLQKLGKRLQLFCVTHQPQVAANANHHFIVEKHTQDNQTFSKVFKLNKQDKIDEIARMLGGITITEQTRSHAREMLELVD